MNEPCFTGSPTNCIALNIPKYQLWGRTAHDTYTRAVSKKILLSRPIIRGMYRLKTALLGCC